ncbi:MAG: ribonuclease H [Parcubacteria group bacterium CG11_big_fil_rev_8_21_14_0_20_41_14]|nr:MAG: ribonuclease H [Parcubacteria group bacterium CG22_combo_CG10-13_8_21_14_all_41_9]PIQ80204.1 MAG: ribonuclease H [Parcubacteria group bacterium CG11_big_fil_rev_8_21_14_0_20_41_14]PIR57417.1 MAG: ribonuclease H [Parcubacteria group bacterium CG10_big_fil_rev_8_21_14_0_10_41_35]PIZ82224.1 MAG: ribonuclease H [Parcubacteria group bacterium CG_4_10_14_0_2_um_filter_41_6]
MMKLIIHTDGGSRGNPGPAGIGAVLSDESGAVKKEISEYIGKATNNQAEYTALVRALEEARNLGAKEVQIAMDSELIVKQLKQEYKVKNKDLAPLFVKVWNLLSWFEKWSIKHVLREKNKRADELVNDALDKK